MTINGIDNRFKKLFKELEAACAEVKQRVNALTEAGEELEAKLSAELVQWQPGWLELTGRLWEMDCGFDKAAKERHRQFAFKSELRAMFRQAPYYERIITKPEGYAGDAEMMNIIYRDQFEGTTPFARFIHKHAVNCKACQSVRNRRELLRDEILKTGSGDVLSLAAGPAREIQDVLSMNPGGRFRFLALDHDINTIRRVKRENRDPRLVYALANAFRVMKGKYLIFQPRASRLENCDPARDLCGKNRFFSPLKYRVSRLKKEGYDLVYSAGLYDYIATFPGNPAKGSTALTRELFRLLKPGGRLIIGNFNPSMPPDVRFVMEYICDWNLIYRNEQEIAAFAQSIPEDRMEKRPSVISEPLGLNSFLVVQKRR